MIELIPCPESPLCDFAPMVIVNHERIYHRDSKFIIVDCLSCATPMVVWWGCTEPSDTEKDAALKIASRVLGKNVVFRNYRVNYQHPHEHLLNKGE